MTTQTTSAELATLITDTLEGIKALDITVLPVSQLTSLTDYMIICSGTSSRHLRAIANHAQDAAKNAGYSAKLEGEGDSEWVLLDLGDAVVHIMLPTARAFYNLEGLWQDDTA